MESIAEAVLQYGESQPDKICLADDRKAVNYKEYCCLIRRMATVLYNLGVRQGDCIIVEAEQSIEYLATELSIQLLGGVFVPIEHNCAKAKIHEFAERVHAALVITINEMNGSTLLKEICRQAETASIFVPQDLPKGSTVGEILFSTGTTGREKGIMLTHANDIALAENAIHGVGMQEDNVELILSPFNHSHGLRRYYANMLRGASVAMQESVMDIKHMFFCFEAYHVNSIDMVPAALHVILQLAGDYLKTYNGQLRYIQIGAAPLCKEDKDQLKSLLPDVRMYNIYGSTESGISLVYEFNQNNEKPNCIGKPSYNTELFVVDENKRPISSSRENPGFLAFRGPMNMYGYWRDEEETSKVMEDGIVYSNDIAFLDKDGDVILLGRQGDVMNIGGKKVSPLEIENVANKLEGIADCGCIPVNVNGYGEVPKLFVQMLPDYVFDARSIRKKLSIELEPYKIPQIIVPISKIPRTYKGSMQRNKLRDL